MASDMRHTTRGGMLPIKHERILKPERPDQTLGKGRAVGAGENRIMIYPADQGFHGRDHEKNLNPEE